MTESAEEFVRRMHVRNQVTANMKLHAATYEEELRQVEEAMMADALDSADAALDELLKRRGFIHWWDGVDDEVQEEIRQGIAAKIRRTW